MSCIGGLEGQNPANSCKVATAGNEIEPALYHQTMLSHIESGSSRPTTIDALCPDIHWKLLAKGSQRCGHTCPSVRCVVQSADK